MTEVDTKTPAVATAPPAPTIEEIVTPDIIKAILKSYNRPDLQLVDFHAEPATEVGDNYMSLIYAVKFNFKNNSGGSEMLPVMLKVLPRNEIRVKMINEGNVFVRDVNMYNQVLPAMEHFQREVAGLSEQEIFTPWPKCFACKADGKTDFLAMEDLKLQGFKMANRKVGLDFDHCTLVIKSIARFHAISYGMFQGDFDKIIEKYPYLEEAMFEEEKIEPMFKEMFKSSYLQISTMLRGNGEEKGANLVDHLYSDKFYEIMYSLVGAKVRRAVINHGDCWINNFLFRYDEETNKPVDLKFVDYQMTKASSRLVDVHYFLYSSPLNDVLNDREKELEDIYYAEFTEFAKKLGVDVEGPELTKENFEEELATYRFYGLAMGLMMALFITADSADVPDMESMKEEDMENVEEVQKFFMNLMKEKAIVKITNYVINHLPRCEQMKEYL